MATYDYQCASCGREESVMQTIGEYCRNPQRPWCCEVVMERRLSVNPEMSGLANALAGDRHYDGLAHSDGTPINSRTKHRQFMKERGYTLAGDFKNEWTKAQTDRELKRMGKKPDPEIKKIVEEQVYRAVAQPD
jgi:hypothetical protein